LQEHRNIKKSLTVSGSSRFTPRRLGGPQGWSGRCEGEKILDPTGTLRPASSQSLYLLRYPNSNKNV
jgi:hypothetical protein